MKILSANDCISGGDGSQRRERDGDLAVSYEKQIPRSAPFEAQGKRDDKRLVSGRKKRQMGDGGRRWRVRHGRGEYVYPLAGEWKKILC